MGVSLVKNYNVEKEHYLTGGFNNLWKIYKGTPKNREGTASVFVFYKRELDKLSSKEEKEEIINILKKEAQALLKFKHPGILGVQEGLLEDKSTLAFVSEYVPNNISSLLIKDEMSKLELKLLTIELLEVIKFLHEDAKVIHMNLNPDCIFVDERNKIKVSGFNFSIYDPSISGSEIKTFSNNKYLSGYTYPYLNYSSPEGVLNNIVTYKSDIYSIGILLANVLNKIYNSKNKQSSVYDRKIIDVSQTNIESYKQYMNKEYNKKLNIYMNYLEQEDKDMLFNMLNQNNQENRPNTNLLKRSNWLNDSKLSALSFIDNLEGNEQQKNSVFLANFPKIISQFDEKTIKIKILPKFLDVLKIELFLPLVTPCIIAIAENKDFNIDFQSKIWPNLKNLFKLKCLPAATLYLIITKIEFISDNISQEEFNKEMMKIVNKCLDCNISKIQNVVLNNITVVIKKIDSQVFKNEIYHRLISILLDTKSLDLKINILKAIKSNLNLLDNSLINDNLLINLEKLRRSNGDLKITRWIIDTYKEASSIVNIEVRYTLYI